MWQKLFGFVQSALSPKFQKISANELHQRLQGGEALVLVDVRTAQEYRQQGHIHGTRHLPLTDFQKRSKKLPKDRPIVCICLSGNRSRSACNQLVNQGFTEVINLSGGMAAWQRAGLPTE